MSLIYPMFALVVLTFVVALVSLRARIQGVRSGQMNVKYFQTFNEGAPTELVVKSGRHFTNLFEVPVLFYVACLAAMIVRADSYAFVAWAWLFVVSRMFHAFIHIGPNKVMPRMLVFLVGCVCVLAMWLVLFLAVSA